MIAIISYVIIAYKKIKSVITLIQEKKNEIDLILDERFKIIQHIIHSLSELSNYEDTVLKDIILFRTTAQTNKIKENFYTQFEFEGKMSKIINKFDILLEQTPLLTQVNDIEKIKQNLLSEEKKLNQAKDEYNQLIFVYKKNMNNIPNMWIINLFKEKLSINPIVWSKNLM